MKEKFLVEIIIGCIEVDHTTLRYWGLLLLFCTFVAWILSQAFYEGWLADVNPVWTNTCIPWPGFDQSILCLCLTKRNALFEPLYLIGWPSLVFGVVTVTWSYIAGGKVKEQRRTLFWRDLVCLCAILAGFVLVPFNLPHILMVSGCG